MKVNEIFYSLQGEGVFTGTAAIFVRLAGCNLHCDFCDTKHEDYTIFTEEEIVKAISDYPAKHVVITGGEPTLQLTHSLVDRLHEVGKFVQIETNGSIALDTDLERSIDWITCSPKTIPVKIQRMNEIKVVYQGQDMEPYEKIATAYECFCSLQPCDVNDEIKNENNLTAAIGYIKSHPRWRLSLQTHKIINIIMEDKRIGSRLRDLSNT